MPDHDRETPRATKLIVIGGSAGAISSLKIIVRSLPPRFPAAICVTVHVSAQSPSYLPAILSDAGPLPAKHVGAEEPLRSGHIYVAPPNHHLLVGADNTVQAIFGAKENRHRPAIDPMFRSAAAAFAGDLLAVLLSGYLDDGTAGLVTLKAAGGRVLIQDPADTKYPDMLRNALAYVRPDGLLPVTSLAHALTNFARGDLARAAAGELTKAATEAPMVDVLTGDQTSSMRDLGAPSLFSCPECKGTLWEIKDGHLIRYRCHEGHAYSPLSLLADQEIAVEQALWTALRSLDEKVALTERLIERAKLNKQFLSLTKYERDAQHAKASAKVLRQLLDTLGQDQQRAEEDDA